MPRLAPTLIAATLLFAGCRNSCQSLCNDMAKVAEDCGFEVSSDDMSACFDQLKDAEREDLRACRDVSGADDISSEWGCDEVDDFFR